MGNGTYPNRMSNVAAKNGTTVNKLSSLESYQKMRIKSLLTLLENDHLNIVQVLHLSQDEFHNLRNHKIRQLVESKHLSVVLASFLTKNEVKRLERAHRLILRGKLDIKQAMKLPEDDFNWLMELEVESDVLFLPLPNEGLISEGFLTVDEVWQLSYQAHANLAKQPIRELIIKGHLTVHQASQLSPQSQDKVIAGFKLMDNEPYHFSYDEVLNLTRDEIERHETIIHVLDKMARHGAIFDDDNMQGPSSQQVLNWAKNTSGTILDLFLFSLIPNLIVNGQLSFERLRDMNYDQVNQVEQGYSLLFTKCCRIDELLQYSISDLKQLTKLQPLISRGYLTITQAYQLPSFAYNNLQDTIVQFKIEDNELTLNQASVLTDKERSLLIEDNHRADIKQANLEFIRKATHQRLQALQKSRQQLEPLRRRQLITDDDIFNYLCHDTSTITQLSDPCIQEMIIQGKLSVQQTSRLPFADINAIKACAPLIKQDELDINDIIQASNNQLARFNKLHDRMTPLSQHTNQNKPPLRLACCIAMVQIDDYLSHDSSCSGDLLLRCALAMAQHQQHHLSITQLDSSFWTNYSPLRQTMQQTVHSQSLQTQILECSLLKSLHTDEIPNKHTEPTPSCVA